MSKNIFINDTGILKQNFQNKNLEAINEHDFEANLPLNVVPFLINQDNLMF